MTRNLLLMLALSGLSGTAFAARWQVEITNVTPGQSFTPFLVAADDAGNTILSPVHYSWNNPVAVVRIRRVH